MDGKPGDDEAWRQQQEVLISGCKTWVCLLGMDAKTAWGCRGKWICTLGELSGGVYADPQHFNTISHQERQKLPWDMAFTLTMGI